MRKLYGASAILLACFLAALQRLRRKRDRIRLLHALETSLIGLRAELAERQRSLGELFRFLSRKSENRTVCAFYNTLYSDLNGLGERGFAEIWCFAVKSSFEMMGESVCDALYPLGGCLGGSELDRQCASLETAARRIAGQERAEKEKLTAERRLNFGLALSAGAFLVIMLM